MMKKKQRTKAQKQKTAVQRVHTHVEDVKNEEVVAFKLSTIPSSSQQKTSSFAQSNIKLLYKDLAKTAVVTISIFLLLFILYLRG